jgi:hypothetical protein
MEAIIIYALFAIFFWIWGWIMKAILNALVKFGIILGRIINTWWSNAYWKKKARHDAWLEDEDKKRDDESATEYVGRMARVVFYTFKYTSDTVDNIPPPTEMYARYRDVIDGFSREWKDDCDGYASLLYHFAAMNGIECYVLAIMAVRGDYGHAVLLYKDKGIWHVQDYLNNYAGTSVESVVESEYKRDENDRYAIYLKRYDYNKRAWERGKGY